MYNNRTYVILTAEEAGNLSIENLSQLMQDNMDNARWNSDKTKTIVTYEGAQPAFLSGKTNLSYEQIIGEISNSEWLTEIEE